MKLALYFATLAVLCGSCRADDSPDRFIFPSQGIDRPPPRWTVGDVVHVNWTTAFEFINLVAVSKSSGSSAREELDLDSQLLPIAGYCTLPSFIALF